MRTGIHANTLVKDGGHDRILDYCYRSKTNVFKTLEFDGAFFRHLKGQCPGIVIIGRVYTSEQGDYGDAARKHTNTVVQMARQFPEVDYWEGFNETGYESPWTAKYAAAEVERVLALAKVGAKAIVGNFSTGQPRVVKDDGGKTLREFLPAVKAAMAHGGALGVHEYSAPYLTWMLDTDAGPVKDLWHYPLEGWLLFRYRKVLAGMGNPAIPVFVTEGGIDGGVRPRPGPQGGGWWDFRDYPDPALGDYAAQRHWAMWHYSHDRRVRGVTSFGECSADPTWHSFSMFKDLNMMEAIIKAESVLPVGHFSGIEPPPVKPTPGLPPIVTPGEPDIVIGVLRGDGWWTIARRIWPTVRAQHVAELQRANTWAMPLKPGYVLTVPRVGGVGVVRRPPAAPYHPAMGMAYPSHAVQPGQTWAMIAARYGVTSAALRAANGGEGDDPDGTPGDGVALVIPGWTVEVR